MKIVEVVHGFPPEVVGGTERYVQVITEGLRDRGHELFVYTGSLTWMENFTVEAVERQGFELTTVHRNDLYFDRWDKAFNPLVEENFREYLASREPDVVHIHHWVRLTSNLGMVAARMGIPVVMTLHDLYITCPRFFRMKEDGSFCVLPLSPENCLHSAERWLFQRDQEIRNALASFKDDVLAELSCAAKLIAPSKSHAATIGERLGLEGPQIDVIPHGNLTNLKPAPRPDPGGKLVIVYFSHLYPFKGAKQLIEAYRQMERKDEASLHLFGAEVLPDYAAECRDLAAGLEVTFHGAYKPEDLETFPMDLVVIPTLLSESYSFILDEASALGVPIVASDAGAIPERSGETVRIFRRGDVESLKGILDELTADRRLLESMRAKPAVEVMPMAKHLDLLEKAYGKVKKAGPAKVSEDRLFQHLKEQWERREYGFKELIRSEQWEFLVATLRKRIVELETELARRSSPG